MRARWMYEEQKDGERFEIGGTMSEMRIGAVNGPLTEVSVEPISLERMRGEVFDEHDVARLQIADRVLWLRSNEVEALQRLLMVARRRGEANLAQRNEEDEVKR